MSFRVRGATDRRRFKLFFLVSLFWDWDSCDVCVCVITAANCLSSCTLLLSTSFVGCRRRQPRERYEEVWWRFHNLSRVRTRARALSHSSPHPGLVLRRGTQQMKELRKGAKDRGERDRNHERRGKLGEWGRGEGEQGG